MATGSDKDKLAAAFESLKIKAPKIESASDLEEFMKFYVSSTDGKKKNSTSYPGIPQFSGDEGRNQISYKTWRYQVRCHIKEKVYTERQILAGIRNSCTGTAGDILRRLGEEASLTQVLGKFEATFSASLIETGESVMMEFYACKQDARESVTTYGSRLDEIFSRAVELKMISPSNEEVLRAVFYQGLLPQLKQQAEYKFETVKDYDAFKIEMRKIESKMKVSENTTSHSATKVDKDDMGEVKDLLKQLHDRIDRLEQEKEERQQSYGYNVTRGQYRGGRQRGFRGNAGRAQYYPRRPIAINTFRPRGHRHEEEEDTRTCFACKKKGHIARNCPEN